MSLEVVTGVILVVAGDGHDIEGRDSLQRVFRLSTQSKHLQEGRLGLVRRVLRATFTLSDPEALTLLDGIMHVFGEETSSQKDFTTLKVAADEEAPIELN